MRRRRKVGLERRRIDECQNLAVLFTFYENLYKFEESHKQLVKESADIERDILLDEYGLAFSMLKLLKQQQEEVRLKIEENKLSFKEIEPIKLPLKNFKPQRSLIIIGFFVLSAVLYAFVQVFSLVRRKFKYVE